jgi:predicted RNA binding protein YcfA (HicA-like mRNA interferase family)
MAPKPGRIDTRLRPMKRHEAERALRGLGFELKNQGGSHQQWRQIRDGRLYKVTLDCHRGEVKAKDVRSMIGQAGVTRDQWYMAAAGYDSAAIFAVPEEQ